MKPELLFLCLVQNIWLLAPLSDADQKLFEAAKQGDINLLNEALAAGANVNAQDRNDETPLHQAAKYGKIDIAKALIKNNADVNAKSNTMRTPLHWAARYGQTDIANILITNGADVSAKNSDNETPLHWAIKKDGHTEKTINHFDIANALIKAEASLEVLQDIEDPFIKFYIKPAFDYVLNLKPGVSRRWNFPETSLSLREATLKQMYEDYMNGKPEALKELLNDPETPQALKSPFKDLFIQRAQGSNFSKFIAKRKKEFTDKKILKQRGEEMRAQAKAISESEESIRTRLQQEYEHELQKIAKQADLSKVRARQQEKLKANVGL